jgi:6-phosphogluconolactonase
MVTPALEVVGDAHALTAALAAKVVAACHHAVARHGRFVIVLAGGATPLAAYRRLAERRDLPWERFVVTWGDERVVPPDHEDRNERAAREALLDHVPVPSEQVLGWPPGDDAAAVARGHAERLRRHVGDPPRFDLVLLGLGADGHTASLFPGTGATAATGLTVSVDGPRGARVSLTAAALGNAAEVLVVVAGAEKREALARSLRGGEPVDALPLSAIQPQGRFTVLADTAAAAGLETAAGDSAAGDSRPADGTPLDG